MIRVRLPARPPSGNSSCRKEKIHDGEAASVGTVTDAPHQGGIGFSTVATPRELTATHRARNSVQESLGGRGRHGNSGQECLGRSMAPLLHFRWGKMNATSAFARTAFLGLVVATVGAPTVATAQLCEARPVSTTIDLSEEHQVVALYVVADPTCEWKVRAESPHVVPLTAAGLGTGRLLLEVAANDTFVARYAQVRVGTGVVRIEQPAGRDTDLDGLPDGWERQFGLNVPVPGDLLDGHRDADADGLTNLQELRAGSHPNAPLSRRLRMAEGVQSSEFDTLIAVANFGHEVGHAQLRLRSPDGSVVAWPLVIPPSMPRFVHLGALLPTFGAEFAIEIDADVPLIAERVVTTSLGGSHSERALTASEAGRTKWMIAEGSTQAGIQLFYLLANQRDVEAHVEITYLGPPGVSPIVRSYAVAPGARRTIWVNVEDDRLANIAVGSFIQSDQPIVVEHAQYRHSTTGGMSAASARAGAADAVAGAVHFAEGATGPYFDMFLAMANASPRIIDVHVRYLCSGNAPVSRVYAIAPQSRQTIWIDHDPALQDSACAMAVAAADGPFYVERSMWWPGDASQWHENHMSGPIPLVSVARTAFGSLEAGRDVYLLVTNPYDLEATFTTTLLFEDGTSASRTNGARANSRSNVELASTFPEAAGRRFAIRVDVHGGLVLGFEIAQYEDAFGLRWARGTASSLK